MERLIQDFMAKAVLQGLVDPAGDVLLGAQDDTRMWNRPVADDAMANKLFSALNPGALMWGRPAPPYGAILAYFARRKGTSLRPRDSETRTFLHDLPIAADDEVARVASLLSRRRAVLLPGGRVVAVGSAFVSDAYMGYSSVCFAAFVAFLCEVLAAVGKRDLFRDEREVLDIVQQAVTLPPQVAPVLKTGPLNSEDAVVFAMSQVGRQTVAHGLVDSFFGNVSARVGDTVYISQTGAPLDALDGCIDSVDMNGGSTAGITASSELSAHMGIYRRTGASVILHGHPRFSVVMSLACDDAACEHRQRCHVDCPRHRYVEGVPVVTGEVGTGPSGLCHTVPAAMVQNGAAIVLGHGVFTLGQVDFAQALQRLFDVERRCMGAFQKRVGHL